MDKKQEHYEEGHHKIEDIIRSMNGLSKEGFMNKYHNDPNFHKGFKVLVNLFIEAKFEGKG